MKNKYTKVRSYFSRELLNRVTNLPSFKEIPEGYWILGVQSKEDTFNEFDDKFYLFKGRKFISVTEGTTNAGITGLLNYEKFNSKGCVVIKTDEWYYDLWSYGLHKNRMPALKQINPIKYFRDWNKNRKVEEIGNVYNANIGINFHTVSYSKDMSIWLKLIGGWSAGCQVVNSVSKYYDILEKVKNQKKITYCLIKEF